jgi:hypothetical protein
MRTLLFRALALTLPIVSCVCCVATAQDYTPFYAPAKVTTGQNYNSYYTQSPSENEHLTGSNQETPQTPAPAPSMTEGCDTCDYCYDDCCGYGTWRENTLLSIGGEAYKSLGDFGPTFTPPGFMDSAGFVGTVNTGFALIPDSPIRGQIGASYGIYDLKGRDLGSPSSSEQQTFVTAGVSKRSDILHDDALSWGLVYDQFWAHQWGIFASELYVGQVRGLVGWALNEYHEVGVWGAFRTTGDNSVTGVSPPPVRAMNQYNAYWRYNWDFGGQTMLYLGANDPADIGSWLFGALGQAPLNDYVSLYGNFVLSFPGSATGVVGSNEEEWAFGVGLTYSLGGKAVSHSVSGPRGLPLLPVANNGSFLITD